MERHGVGKLLTSWDLAQSKNHGPSTGCTHQRLSQWPTSWSHATCPTSHSTLNAWIDESIDVFGFLMSNHLSEMLPATNQAVNTHSCRGDLFYLNCMGWFLVAVVCHKGGEVYFGTQFHICEEITADAAQHGSGSLWHNCILMGVIRGLKPGSAIVSPSRPAPWWATNVVEALCPKGSTTSQNSTTGLET